MSSLSDFQEQYGAAWSEIVSHPAFSAALAMANAEKIQGITDLTDSEIESRGQIILSSLRGHLQYEAALLSLHQKKDKVFADLGEPEYPSPEDEAVEEAVHEQQVEHGIDPTRLASAVRLELEKKKPKRAKKRKKR